ncbi:MAG: GGDEF domain-containing protein [Vibrio sp.]|uniref:GGDEF domain-containing protein n=1 Tax=Vibrio sp. TaxID=678 RepID=UPI003A83D76D
MKSINRIIFNNILIFFSVSVFCVIVQKATFLLEDEEELFRYNIYKIKNITSVIYKLSDDLSLLSSLYLSTGDKKYKEIYSEVLGIKHGDKPFPNNYFSFLNKRFSSNMTRDDFKEIVNFQEYISDLYDEKYQYESKVFLEVKRLLDVLEDIEMKSIHNFDHGLPDKANEYLKSNYYTGIKLQLSEKLFKLESNANNRLLISAEKTKQWQITLRILVLFSVVFLFFYIGFTAYRHQKNIRTYISRLEGWIDQISDGVYDLNFSNSTFKEFSGIKDKLKTLAEKTESLVNKINAQAETDSLTNLPNRRSLINFLKGKKYDVSRYNAKCSVVLIDIDKF